MHNSQYNLRFLGIPEIEFIFKRNYLIFSVINTYIPEDSTENFEITNKVVFTIMVHYTVSVGPTTSQVWGLMNIK